MRLKITKFRNRGRGAVLTIAGILITSALLRMSGGATEAFAQVTNQPLEPDAQKEDEAIASVNTPSTQAELLGTRSEISKFLDALIEREKRVKTLETQIALRKKALQIADQEINKRIENLEKAERNLRKTLALADGAAENDLAKLTTVYENMKPKDASALFSAMEPDFAAGFLGRMRPDAAAAIMAGLPPDIAYSISVILAGRNANVPKT